MTKYLITFLLISCTCFAQSNKTDEPKKDEPSQKVNLSLTPEELAKIDEHTQKAFSLYTYIAKYIQKTKIEPFVKEIPKLEEKLQLAIDRAKRAKTQKTKDKYIDIAKDIKIELEVHKLWKDYHKVYLIYYVSYQEKKFERFGKAEKAMDKLHTRYTVITGEKFPNIRREFKTAYPKIVAKVLSDDKKKK